MREIKFRGKRVDNGEWIIGNLYQMEFESFIFLGLDDIAVLHETVGQYTGLKDKDGGEIYEGDVLADDLCSVTRLIMFESGGFVAGVFTLRSCVLNRLTIIGNIRDNPELIEAADA